MAWGARHRLVVGLILRRKATQVLCILVTITVLWCLALTHLVVGLLYLGLVDQVSLVFFDCSEQHGAEHIPCPIYAPLGAFVAPTENPPRLLLLAGALVRCLTTLRLSRTMCSPQIFVGRGALFGHVGCPAARRRSQELFPCTALFMSIQNLANYGA